MSATRPNLVDSDPILNLYHQCPSPRNEPERKKGYGFTDQSYVKHKILIPNIYTLKLENNLGICSQLRCTRLKPRRMPPCPCHRGRWAQRRGSGGARKYAWCQNRRDASCRCRRPCWVIDLGRLLSRTSRRGGDRPHRPFALRRRMNYSRNCWLLPRDRDGRRTCPRPCMCAFRYLTGWQYYFRFRSFISTAKPSKGARIIYGSQNMVSWDGQLDNRQRRSLAVFREFKKVPLGR